jgi:hypothetical protein
MIMYHKKNTLLRASTECCLFFVFKDRLGGISPARYIEAGRLFALRPKVEDLLSSVRGSGRVAILRVRLT